MITNNLTTQELDTFLSIASFVDNKLPKVGNRRSASMFKVIDDVYGIGHDKESIKNLENSMTKVKKSYRDLKKMYLDVSHEKLRYMYLKALKKVCIYANKNLKKYK